MTATKLFPWQPWEDEILRGMWPTEPPDIIMMELDSGRSTKAIVQRAFRLGLKKEGQK